jgi:hypothetical protein
LILYRLALASLSCITVEGCNAQIRQEQIQQLAEVKPVPNIQFSADTLTRRKRRHWDTAQWQLVPSLEVENSQPIPVTLPSERELRGENRVPPNSRQLFGASASAPVGVSSYMLLTPTGMTNAQNNPLYQLSFYANGQLIRAYAAVTGRAYTQTRNRQQAGTQAPLPNGRYRVFKSTIPGTTSEVGGRFLPIQPLFRTGRSGLGIHYDPSFGQGNGEDGTEGCIALTNQWELDELLNYVRIYQPEYLEVNIQ